MLSTDQCSMQGWLVKRSKKGRLQRTAKKRLDPIVNPMFVASELSVVQESTPDKEHQEFENPRVLAKESKAGQKSKPKKARPGFENPMFQAKELKEKNYSNPMLDDELNSDEDDAAMSVERGANKHAQKRTSRV